ncbi:MAG: RNA methyltransferase [Nitrososphaerales archaeon]
MVNKKSSDSRYQEPARKRGFFQSIFSVAFVEPEYSVNIGYVARTMANFGLTDLYLVGTIPKTIDFDEAEKFASHAHLLVRKIRRMESVEDLRRKFQVLVGTTAILGKRKSNITRKTMSISECTTRVTALLAKNRKYRVCLILGRDTTGLTNEELQGCDFSTTIQTGSTYNTFNVSHAAAIFLFAFSEKLKKLGHAPGGKSPSAGSRRREKELVLRLFEDLATESEFREFKKAKLMEALTRLINRSDPSIRELYLLMGLASRATSKIRRLSRQDGANKLMLR